MATRKWWVMVALLGSLALVAACGDDEQNGAVACSTDANCPVGMICGASGTCVTLPCAGNVDCLNGDQACITVSQQSVCSLVECGCANCPQCPVGEVCQNGQCTFPGGGNACPNGQTDCSVDEVCDGGTCRPCVGNECPSEGCVTSGCDSGFTCDQQTGDCVPEGTSGTPCGSCGTVDDCGGMPWKCAPLADGQRCLPPCANNGECPTGWLCQAGNCVPSNFRCDGCSGQPCPSGQACNPNTNACEGGVAQCASCSDDWQCGAGNACHAGTCVPRCQAGTCPIGGGCTSTASGIPVCEDPCAASCSPACHGAAPHCVDGSCVQCRNEGDCSPGQSCNSGICEGQGSCVAPTPYELNGSCVQCIHNDHCPGAFCNTQTNLCESDVCASCVAPYPACTQIGNDWYCVQCAVDADCGAGGSCNTQTFACQGGTVTPTDPCSSSADCVDPTGTFNLACDTSTGLCYDTNGMCDGVTAHCRGTLPSTGEPPRCMSLLEAFGGGAFPSMPGGGTAIPGYCGCEWIVPLLVSTCESGTCLDLGAIMALLGGGTSSGSGAFCFSL